MHWQDVTPELRSVIRKEKWERNVQKIEDPQKLPKVPKHVQPEEGQIPWKQLSF